ncbi:hypothetical protein FBU30_006752 [Linnemannia zychae]|nr:hypothetical protein FBU30_006752 [Linnemannia zychae]
MEVTIFGSEPEMLLLRDSSLLNRVGSRYEFVHRSVLEYFYSCNIWGPFSKDDTLDEPIYSSICDHPLSKRNLVNEPSIIQFLVERAYQNAKFKHYLLAIIKQSKVSEHSAQAAANAITILVKAGVQFNGKDFRGIRIPGVDLKGGKFDSVQLQGADLRNVSFTKSWVPRADFTGASMDGVKFGELPFLKFECAVCSCAFSSDEGTFAVGFVTGRIFIYNTLTWMLIQELKCHTCVYNFIGLPYFEYKLSFWSSNSQLFLSCLPMKCLWKRAAGSADFLLERHLHSVIAMAVSPCGKQMIIADYNKTVRVHEVDSGSIVCILSGHTWSILEFTYSVDGMNILTGNDDDTIRVYDTQTGQARLVLNCGSFVNSIVYPPDGSKLLQDIIMEN